MRTYRLPVALASGVDFADERHLQTSASTKRQLTLAGDAPVEQQRHERRFADISQVLGRRRREVALHPSLSLSPSLCLSLSLSLSLSLAFYVSLSLSGLKG